MTDRQGATAASAGASGADAGSTPALGTADGPDPPAASGVQAAPATSGGREAAPATPAVRDAAPATPGGGPTAPGGEPASPRGPVTSPAPGGARHAARRVDGRKLEAALLDLRRQIVDTDLVFETKGAEKARDERRKLIGQIDDYLLPRVRQSGAPVLVALVGSTGAGKSTLVNSIVGTQVSATGIRRPTTNSPVLACHPDDVDWFAENVFLPTVPRVRQEGLARSGRDGLLVLAASEGMPKGIALLDTPDIDSVVRAHHEFAHQFLDASDLWLFMTTGSRYADAAVWELLQYARDRGASLAIVLSRVPPSAGAELTRHFGAMLEANGLGGNERFAINETVITDGRLPPEASGPVRGWLENTASRADRRVAVLTQTMAGALDTFRTRVPALAAEAQAQLAIRADLSATVAGAYGAALAEAEEALRNGSLLSGDILARWQEFAGTGELLRGLQAPGRRPVRQRKKRGLARAQSLITAVRSGIESLLVSVADRAAEESVSRWRNHPAGAALLDRLSAGHSADAWAHSQFAMDAGLIFSDAPRPGSLGAGGAAVTAAPHAPAHSPEPDNLARSSADLSTRSVRAISGWQDHVLRLVQADTVAKRSIARVGSFDDVSLATVLEVAMLGHQNSADDADDGAPAVPQVLLTSLLGAGPMRSITTTARQDLRERLRLLLEEEMLRFTQIAESAGSLDEATPARLHQVAEAVEKAR